MVHDEVRDEGQIGLALLFPFATQPQDADVVPLDVCARLQHLHLVATDTVYNNQRIASAVVDEDTVGVVTSTEAGAQRRKARLVVKELHSGTMTQVGAEAAVDEEAAGGRRNLDVCRKCSTHLRHRSVKLEDARWSQCLNVGR